MKKLCLFCLLLLTAAASWAKGLSFVEEMHGYAYYQGEYRRIDVYLSIRINDIDAWRSNQNYPSTVTGTMNVERLASQAVSGTLQILAPAPAANGRLLTYRLAGSTLQFNGIKFVHDDGGFDLVDDTTTLRGVLQDRGQAVPAIDELLNHGAWTAEMQFEWWKPAVLLNFVASFKTISTPWYEDLLVKAQFISTVFGAVGRVFFPWAYL